MCTVTYLPGTDRILLTSNRDERTSRLPAALPQARQYASGSILYPRDGEAGGTWIALHENGNAMVLLNGAFVRHTPVYPYRKSRGLIFLEIFDSLHPVDAFHDIDLDNIEPFTLVIWQQGALWEARWDGGKKHSTALPATEPRMWCSATLYDEDVIARRQSWFAQWLIAHPHPSASDIRSFHKFAGDGNSYTDLLMNRDGLLMTVSITGMELGDNNARMHYKDIRTGEETEQTMGGGKS